MAVSLRVYLKEQGIGTGENRLDERSYTSYIENGLFLLHDDADFDKIARHFHLKIRE